MVLTINNVYTVTTSFHKMPELRMYLCEYDVTFTFKWRRNNLSIMSAFSRRKNTHEH